MLFHYWASISESLPQTGEKLGEGIENEAKLTKNKSLYSLNYLEFLSGGDSLYHNYLQHFSAVWMSSEAVNSDQIIYSTCLINTFERGSVLFLRKLQRSDHPSLPCRTGPCYLSTV